MKEFKTKIGQAELIIKPNDLAEQANGSCLVQYGDTVVLGTATMSNKDREDADFFPLTVDYEERFYAAGKIKGSRFTKREGRPSDSAIITSRMIDRAVRPRFPKELKRDVQLVATCLSWDAQNDPDIAGFLAVSLSLAISDIPWHGPLAAVRVGLINNEFVVNPTYQQMQESSLDLVFSGFQENNEMIINMIESGIKEVDEKTVLDAFLFAEKTIKETCDFLSSIVKEIGLKKIEIIPEEIDPDFKEKILTLTNQEIEQAFKESRKELIETAKEKALLFIKQEYPDSPEKKRQSFNLIEESFSQLVRKKILDSDERIDNRHPDELRKLEARVAVLPRTHGSGLFSRGQTKSLSILTLGAPGDHQLLEDMENVSEKRFLHHYNFPPYSVGEVRPMRGPGRREIGHGMLAEKALLPMIPDFEEFPYTIRIVSEIVSSNGSTSMASVTSSSLALMDAGIPIKAPVAGISIGIIEDENKKYKLLTDIQGTEDHCGGMDLKIAGTRKGITALQMDVKIDGINQSILKEALEKARIARMKILDTIEETISKPRENLSCFAPRVVTFKINPDKIREVIGTGGKVINEIIAKTKATIDIEDSGVVFVTSEKESNAQKAVEWIKNIVREVQVNEVFQGRVKRIMDFGCFVEILPNQEGLVHISKLSDKRVEKVEDVVKIGDIVPVKVIEIDNLGRINLSIKDAKK